MPRALGISKNGAVCGVWHALLLLFYSLNFWKSSFQFMQKKLIEDQLSSDAKSKLNEIYTHRALDSTNSEAVRILESGKTGIQLIVANLQTKGRGRRGRSWVSPEGGGLYMSLLHPVSGDIGEVQALSLVSALSVHQSLTQKKVSALKVKWPNDLLVGKKKLAGILLELHTFEGSTYIVFGIGVNYSFDEIQKANIDRPVTDLRGLLDDLPMREELVANICSDLLKNIERFSAKGFEPFQSSWNHYDHYFGSDIVIENGRFRYIGKSLGVDQKGVLVLETTEGERLISAGEIIPTLRKLNENY